MGKRTTPPLTLWVYLGLLCLIVIITLLAFFLDKRRGEEREEFSARVHAYKPDCPEHRISRKHDPQIYDRYIHHNHLDRHATSTVRCPGDEEGGVFAPIVGGKWHSGGCPVSPSATTNEKHLFNQMVLKGDARYGNKPLIRSTGEESSLLDDMKATATERNKQVSQKIQAQIPKDDKTVQDVKDTAAQFKKYENYLQQNIQKNQETVKKTSDLVNKFKVRVNAVLTDRPGAAADASEGSTARSLVPAAYAQKNCNSFAKCCSLTGKLLYANNPALPGGCNVQLLSAKQNAVDGSRRETNAAAAEVIWNKHQSGVAINPAYSPMETGAYVELYKNENYVGDYYRIQVLPGKNQYNLSTGTSPWPVRSIKLYSKSGARTHDYTVTLQGASRKMTIVENKSDIPIAMANNLKMEIQNPGAYVQVFEHVNYKGRSAIFPAGPSRISLTNVDTGYGRRFWNDRISSFKLFGGAKVQFYKHVRSQPYPTQTRGANNMNAINANDEISAIHVS